MNGAEVPLPCFRFSDEVLARADFGLSTKRALERLFITRQSLVNIHLAPKVNRTHGAS
jgi:hypothetical protein